MIHEKKTCYTKIEECGLYLDNRVFILVSKQTITITAFLINTSVIVRVHPCFAANLDCYFCEVDSSINHPSLYYVGLLKVSFFIFMLTD